MTNIYGQTILDMNKTYTKQEIIDGISKVYGNMGFTSIAAVLIKQITNEEVTSRELPNLYTKEEIIKIINSFDDINKLKNKIKTILK